MELFTTLFLFVLGFFVLIKGAQVLVHGAVSIARIYGISGWVIGMVIVGIGSSIPDLSIMLASAFDGNSIGLSAIIGSSAFNLLVILGIAAVIAPVAMRREWVFRDVPMNAGVVMLAGAFILFPILGDPSWVGISRLEALVLTGLFIAWIIFMLTRQQMPDETLDQQVYTGVVSAVLISVGLLGVFFGGAWVVDGAEALAALLGASPTLVGLTIVAIGSSVQNLIISLVAFSQRQIGVAVGNVIGTNIFDFLGVLGISALIHPVPVLDPILFDVIFALGATFIIISVLFVGKGFTVSRTEGALMLSSYLLYITAIVARG
jgi:cation:H+ antiporter